MKKTLGILVSLAVTLFNIAVPGLGASYATYFKSVRLEFLIVTVNTALFLLGLPERYRRPHCLFQMPPNQSHSFESVWKQVHQCS